jgi:hypothetical protein
MNTLVSAGYIFEHVGERFAPDGRVDGPVDVQAHNEALETQELALWSTKPELHCAYVTGTKVATWLGAELGEIKASSVHRNNFGARITCVTVSGNNGATYHGRYGSDWSQLVRLRKSR